MAKRDKQGPSGGTGAGRKGSGPTPREHWKEEPDEHDYPAARDYLSLLLGETDARRTVTALQRAPVTHRKAKDLLRASRLALLGPDDPEVQKDLRKVRRDQRLSPVLVVRGALVADVAVTVADGYHRICASYHLDEDADIPCRIVDPPRPTRGPREANGQGRDGTRRRAAPATATASQAVQDSAGAD
ncbi:MAG TPA: hypothetical protein VND62_01770 [Acidimicrobiales bacterium]|nr:hypothetical protein [Acidimicrobiales bacterium]